MLQSETLMQPARCTTFRLPDLASRSPSVVTCHPNADAINDVSVNWYANWCSDFTDKKQKELRGLKAGILAAHVYADSDDERLRIMTDFMHYFFLLDDLSDGMLNKDTAMLAEIVTNALECPHSYRRISANGKELPEREPDVSKMARDFWARCIQNSTPRFQARFSQSLIYYLKSIHMQAQDRDSGLVPSLRSYIESRRDNSGVWPLLDAIEYTNGIDLPDNVIDHPIIKVLKQCANDFVAWSNDIFSFNAEQARDDHYNMVVILMKHHDLDIQGAVDCCADMCCQTIDTFNENKEKLPSWGPELDKNVSVYVQGLENWISGSLLWSFISERYFGPKVFEIKQHRVVELFPPKSHH